MYRLALLPPKHPVTHISEVDCLYGRIFFFFFPQTIWKRRAKTVPASNLEY